jgi:hypothetical protein
MVFSLTDLLDRREDVALRQDQDAIFAFIDLRARVLAVHNGIAVADLHRRSLDPFSRRPGPVAITVPRAGAFFAPSGIIIPPGVCF